MRSERVWRPRMESERVWKPRTDNDRAWRPRVENERMEKCQKFKTVQTKAAGKAKPFTFFLLTS